MRILMTEEIARLYDEVFPYYDEAFHLAADAPDDIKQKDAIIAAYNEQEYKKAELYNR